jgi:hypothetical protein
MWAAWPPRRLSTSAWWQGGSASINFRQECRWARRRIEWWRATQWAARLVCGRYCGRRLAVVAGWFRAWAGAAVFVARDLWRARRPLVVQGPAGAAGVLDDDVRHLPAADSFAESNVGGVSESWGRGRNDSSRREGRGSRLSAVEWHFLDCVGRRRRTDRFGLWRVWRSEAGAGRGGWPCAAEPCRAGRRGRAAALDGGGGTVARKAGQKAGCGHDCPPHNHSITNNKSFASTCAPGATNNCFTNPPTGE